MSFDSRLNFIRLDKDKNLTFLQRFAMFMQGVKYERRKLSEHNFKSLMYDGIYIMNGKPDAYKQEFQWNQFSNLDSEFRSEFQIPLAIETNFNGFDNLYYPSIFFENMGYYNRFNTYADLSHLKINFNNDKCWIILCHETKPMLQWSKYLKNQLITYSDKGFIKENFHEPMWGIQTKIFKSFFIPAFPYGHHVPSIEIVNRSLTSDTSILHYNKLDEMRNILFSYYNSQFIVSFIDHWHEYSNSVRNNGMSVSFYQHLERHRDIEQESDLNRLLGIATEVARSREQEVFGIDISGDGAGNPDVTVVDDSSNGHVGELYQFSGGGGGGSVGSGNGYTTYTITRNIIVNSEPETKESRKKKLANKVDKTDKVKEKKHKKEVKNKDGDNPILDLEL